MNGIKELEEFAKGAANGLPTGEPKLGSGPEQGGKIEGKGKTSGNGDSPSVKIDAPPVAKEKLSGDDKEDEDQMKPHKKPIETAKSMDVTNPNQARDAVAHEQAVKVSNLRKSEEDVQVGVGVQEPKVDPEPMVKSKVWNHGTESMVQMSNASDLAAAKFAKSDDFYPHGSPSIPRNAPLTASKTCPKCEGKISKSLTACPGCGHGTVHVQVENIKEVKLQKSMRSYQGFRPSNKDQDVFLPVGVSTDK